MSATRTQLSATIACYYMRRWKYEPKSIINVGVGGSHELSIWRWLIPDAQLLGIDTRLRHKMWNAPYVHGAASNESGKTLTYCRWCRSVKCNLPDHINRYECKTVTVDEVAKDLPGPCFMWLDCEGSELDALRGATETLKRTRFISLEVREHPWTDGYRDQLHKFLEANNYRLEFRNADLDDRIYHRRRGTV